MPDIHIDKVKDICELLAEMSYLRQEKEQMLQLADEYIVTVESHKDLLSVFPGVAAQIPVLFTKASFNKGTAQNSIEHFKGQAVKMRYIKDSYSGYATIKDEELKRSVG
ncbi:hypothetical protein BH09BAC1_BH09BAC1_04070 [soil metagenome]